ncbi:MAG: HIT domain-containing protein [Candidatus Marinimicrobia bacterium]|nr:HIT domain-containing protein [Candidatus Neomarinimicrobiota bacterium]MBL7047572.1 HIT domain-containing protein [Candidatus Neomarinimicrobiota bacterium]
MDRLWAPWRMEYIRRMKEDGCIFCDKPKAGNDREMLILYRGKNAFVMMNYYPYNNGHLMISPYHHCDNTHDLNQETLNEIMYLADKSMSILKKTMDAQGFNFGANIFAEAGAGIEEHIHFHIVPRWMGDTNFMPVIGHTKVQVQGLLETYDELRAYFNQLKKKGD